VKNILRIATLLLPIISIVSCANLNDTHVDLGDGYTYKTDSKYRSIYPNKGYYNTAIYSTILNYDFDNKHIIAKQKPDYQHHKIFIASDLESRYSIYCSFLRDSTSKDFYNETSPVIREAIKADKDLYKLFKSKGITDQNSIGDQEKIQVTVDSVFKHDPFFIKLFSQNENYWIINKDQNLRWGPLSKQEFEKKASELSIKLKFKKD
jgi:hypothetical protein